MSSGTKAARGIYRDVEKLYRLYGLYNRKQEQLEQHVKIIQQNFIQNFKSEEISGDWVHFHFLMSGVMYEGEEIFKAETPEITLGYMLFCEGVKTLLLAKNVNAKDVLQWETRIRKFLDDQDSGKNEDSDLATVLWKNPHPSIRVALYNALIDLAETAEKPLDDSGEKTGLLEGFSHDTKKQKGLHAEPDWHDRDRDWDLPSAESIFHQTIEADDLKADQVERLRAELADASVSDRAKKILPFQTEEIEHLRQEMEMLDENHVEFNLLVRYFAVIKQSTKMDLQSVGPTVQALAKIAVSIIDRFHGGLVLFYLKKLSELAEAGVQADVVEKLRGFLKDAIRRPQNLILLAEALNEPTRSKTARQMIQYIEMKDMPLIFDLLVDAKREAGIQAFISALIELYPEADQEFLKWGEDRIVQLIPRLQGNVWKARTKFFARCLRIRSSSILAALLPQIGELPMKSDEALSLYERLMNSERHLFLEGLLSIKALKDWAVFVRRVLTTGAWREESEDIVSLWVRASLRHLGPQTFELIEPVISGRTFRFWPRYANARESILLVLLSLKEAAYKSKVSEIVAREKGLMFQSPTIKRHLEEYR